VLRHIKRFLKSGIQEDGTYRASERGTPQGGVMISPLFANIYLHYTLDLWFQRVFIPSCLGHAHYIRYADDYVACFQNKEDTARFRHEMEQRLHRFGLEFGPFAQQRAKGRVLKTESFDFLGFTHYCARSRDGRCFRMKRKTISKRFSVKLRVYKDWLCANRTLPTPEIMKTTAAKLRGHYAYYCVTDNSKSISTFAHEVRNLLLKWLNRRGKRNCMSWEKFELLLQRYLLPNRVSWWHNGNYLRKVRAVEEPCA